MSSHFEQNRKIEEEALALVASANEGVRGTRTVTKRAVLTVVKRSIYENKFQTFSVRKHRALADVSAYISLAQKNKTVGFEPKHTDLLPIAHPLSTRSHELSSSAFSHHRARWFADDPRIQDEEIRSLVASALSAPYGSAEYEYASARLDALPYGALPFDEDQALVAGGILFHAGLRGVRRAVRGPRRAGRRAARSIRPRGWLSGGNSSAARRARAMVQRRDRNGRFAFMGGGIRSLIKRASRAAKAAKRAGRQLGKGELPTEVRSLIGRVVAQGPNNTFEVELGNGKIVRMPAQYTENVKAYLDKGKRDKQGYGPAPKNISVSDPVIDENDLVFIDAPSGFKAIKDWEPDPAVKEYYGPDADYGRAYTDDTYYVLRYERADGKVADDERRALEARSKKFGDVGIRGAGKDGAIDPDKQLFIVQRGDEQTWPFGLAQSWADIQEMIKQDDPLFRDGKPSRPKDAPKVSKEEAESRAETQRIFDENKEEAARLIAEEKKNPPKPDETPEESAARKERQDKINDLREELDLLADEEFDEGFYEESPPPIPKEALEQPKERKEAEPAKDESYVPKGPTEGQTSPDYTDDPVELEQKFGEEKLQEALEEAEKSAPKGQDPDYVNLPFEDGDEVVPSDAVKEALSGPEEPDPDAPDWMDGRIYAPYTPDYGPTEYGDDLWAAYGVDPKNGRIRAVLVPKEVRRFPEEPGAPGNAHRDRIDSIEISFDPDSTESRRDAIRRAGEELKKRYDAREAERGRAAEPSPEPTPEPEPEKAEEAPTPEPSEAPESDAEEPEAPAAPPAPPIDPPGPQDPYNESSADPSDPEDNDSLPNAASSGVYEDEEFPPTPEQRAIIDAVLTGEDVVVRALAGTGKTSTLKMIARRILRRSPDKRIVYVAFNKTVQLEAEGAMPKNVESRTADSLAFVAMGRKITKKFNWKDGLVTLKDISREFEIKGFTYENKKTGRNTKLENEDAVDLAKKVINNYAISADDQIGPQHFPGQLLEEMPEAAQQKLLEYANLLWEDIKSEDGKLSINNTHITKMWALSRPDLSQLSGGVRHPADIIFFDEAQDINPVLAKIIRDQKIQKVYVGDENQAIYAFRGAEDELQRVEAPHDLPLRKSWRFGPEIAGVANRFLTLLGARYRVEGGGPEGRILSPGTMADADAILTRSNAGALGAILEELERGRSVGVAQSFKSELENLVRSASWLKFKKGPKPSLHQDLAQFNSWEEVGAAVRKDPDNKKLAMLYNLVERNGIGGLNDIVKKVKVVSNTKRDEDVEFKPLTVDDLRVGRGIVADGVGFEVGGGAEEFVIQINGGFMEVRRNKDKIKKKFGAVWDRGAGPDGKDKFLYWGKTFNSEEDALEALNFLKADIENVGPVPEEDRVDVVVTTAHKAKGLEWNKVKIYDDFTGPREDTEGNVIMPDPEEIRLAYVSVTRAKRELDPGALSWVFQYTNDSDEQPKPDAPRTAPVSPERADAEPDLPPLLQGLSEAERAELDRTGDHTPYLPENPEFDNVPEGLAEIPSAPYQVIEGDLPEDLPEDFSGNPVDLANRFDAEELEEALREAVSNRNTPGFGQLEVVDQDGEVSSVNVRGDALRDALHLQGEDPNSVIQEVYDQERSRPEPAERRGRDVPEELRQAGQDLRNEIRARFGLEGTEEPGDRIDPETYFKLLGLAETLETLYERGVDLNELLDVNALEFALELLKIRGNAFEGVRVVDQQMVDDVEAIIDRLARFMGIIRKDMESRGEQVETDPEEAIRQVTESSAPQAVDAGRTPSPSEWDPYDSEGGPAGEEWLNAQLNAGRSLEDILGEQNRPARPKDYASNFVRAALEAVDAIPIFQSAKGALGRILSYDGIQIEVQFGRGEPRKFRLGRNALLTHISLPKRRLKAVEPARRIVPVDDPEVLRQNAEELTVNVGDAQVGDFIIVSNGPDGELLPRRIVGKEYERRLATNIRRGIVDPLAPPRWDEPPDDRVDWETKAKVVFITQDPFGEVVRRAYNTDEDIKVYRNFRPATPSARAPEPDRGQGRDREPEPTRVPEGSPARTPDQVREAESQVGDIEKVVVRARDLRAGDVAVRDGEYFIVEEVDVPQVPSEDENNKKVNRVKVKGYYPGRRSQERDWFANGDIEIVRNAAVPEKGDLDPIEKPDLKDYGRMAPEDVDGKREWFPRDPDQRARYEADMDEYRRQVRAAGNEFNDAMLQAGIVDRAEEGDDKPADGPFIASVRAADLVSGDVSTKDHFTIMRVFRDPETKDGFVSIEGYYPGHVLQRKEWKQDTKIEVIRGLDEADRPPMGDFESLHRPFKLGPRGGWYPDDDTQKNAQHQALLEEAHGRWNAPENLPIVSTQEANADAAQQRGDQPVEKPKAPFVPPYPTFQGRFAEWAREAQGDWKRFRDLLRDKEYIVFDFETTGVDPEDGNEPYQIAAYRIVNGEVVDKFIGYMNPGRDIENTWAGRNARDPDGNPINNAFFNDKPSQEELMRQLFEWLGENPLMVAQNAKFDDDILRRMAERLGVDYSPDGIADIMGLGAAVRKDDPDVNDRRKNLKVLAEYVGYDLKNWHNAEADVEAEAEIFRRLIDKAAELGFGVEALNPDAEMERYQREMEAFNARQEKFLDDYAKWLAQNAVQNPENANLENIQKNLRDAENSLVPAGPIENGGEVGALPQRDRSVEVDENFPDGQMKIVGEEFYGDENNVDILRRGDIKAGELLPGDFVPINRGNPQMWQLVAVGEEEELADGVKRRFFFQNDKGEKKNVLWRPNAFLDEVRRPKNRADLAAGRDEQGSVPVNAQQESSLNEATIIPVRIFGGDPFEGGNESQQMRDWLNGPLNGETEIEPVVNERGERSVKATSRVRDADNNVLAESVKNFDNEADAEAASQDEVERLAQEIRNRLAQGVDDARELLRSEGRDRHNLPPIPPGLKRQVYIRMLAGLYADADGNPLAIGDVVEYDAAQKPKQAGKWPQGVVVGKKQGTLGGLKRGEVVYVDYVLVQYPGEKKPIPRVSRFQRHVDQDVAKQRFDAEPVLVAMDKDVLDQAIEDRKVKKKAEPVNKEVEALAKQGVENVRAESAVTVPPESEAPEPAAPDAAPEPSEPVREVPDLPEPKNINIQEAKARAKELVARVLRGEKPDPDEAGFNEEQVIRALEKMRREFAEIQGPDRRRSKRLNEDLRSLKNNLLALGFFDEAREVQAILDRKDFVPLREISPDEQAQIDVVAREGWKLLARISRSLRQGGALNNRFPEEKDRIKNSLYAAVIFRDPWNIKYRIGYQGLNQGLELLREKVANDVFHGQNQELLDDIDAFISIAKNLPEPIKLPPPRTSQLPDDQGQARLERIRAELVGADWDQLVNGFGDWEYGKRMSNGINAVILLRNKKTGEEVIVKQDDDYKRRGKQFKGNGVNAEEMVAQLYRDLGFAQPAVRVLNRDVDPDPDNENTRGVIVMEFAGDGFFNLENIGIARERREPNRDIENIMPEYQEEILHFLVANGIVGNTDRHASNYMYGQDPVTGKWRLIPIDNGLALMNGRFGEAEDNLPNNLHFRPDKVILGRHGNANGAMYIAKQYIRKVGRDQAKSSVAEFAERMRTRAEIMDLIDPRANGYISERAQWILDNLDTYLDAILNY